MIFLLFTLLFGCITQQRIRRSQARTELGTAYLVEGSAPQAIKTLQDATKLNPRNSHAWEKLGLSYASQGAYDKAEDAFERSLKVEERAETHNNFGLMLLAMERYQDAIFHFEAASTDITYRNIAISLNNLGQTYYVLGRHQEALRSLTNAVRRAPNLCQARFLRGVVHRELHMNGKALSDFQEVIRLCGENAFGAYFQAAELLIENEDIPAACSYLQTIQREAPNTPLSSQAKQTHTEVCL